MGDLLKKLDEIMTSNLVRKLGGLFCLVAVIITAAAFLIGAGSVLKTMKGPVATVETTDKEAEGEATNEDHKEADEAEETEE
jgi:hypothetical protein